MAHLVLIVLLFAVGTASGNEPSISAKDILKKMVTSMSQSNFQGTVVFLKNDKLEAMKYSHLSTNNQEQERLVSLNSPPREIIRDSDQIKCFYKLTQQVVIDHRPYEHSFIVDVPANLDDYEASYRFEVVGEEFVAMLPTHVVAIQPKDEFRYVRKIWVSKEQYLPVKAAVYAQDGEILEQVVFTDIQVNTAIPATQQPKNAANKPMTAANPPSTDYHNSFEISMLPPGFKEIFFTRKPLPHSSQPVDHVMLSDGFASVSVYLETKKDAAANNSLPEGIHSVGAVNSLSQPLADSQLTVLGEVPVATVKYIAEGIKLKPSKP